VVGMTPSMGAAAYSLTRRAAGRFCVLPEGGAPRIVAARLLARPALAGSRQGKPTRFALR
jgi:hypothetical protein